MCWFFFANGLRYSLMYKIFLLLAMFLSFACLSAALPKLENTEISALYNIEKQGMQAYRAEKYSEAYTHLSKTAPLGFKQSQYYLAFLYLKGQHLKKDMLEGMGWLGVAKESGHREMIKLYDGLYNAFNQAQQDAVDKKVSEYVALYGMQEQNVSCEKRKKSGSKRLVLECVKIPIKVDYEINRVPSPMEFQ